MSGMAAPLTAADVDNVAAYYASLPPVVRTGPPDRK
jgi:cytochrome c553